MELFQKLRMKFAIFFFQNYLIFYLVQLLPVGTAFWRSIPVQYSFLHN